MGSAQPTQQDFELAWKDAISLSLPQGTHAAWEEIAYPEMTVEEARILIDRIGDDQSQPGWAEAKQALFLGDGGQINSTYHIWYIDDLHYRINEDTPKADWSPTIDAVTNDQIGWIRGANGVLTVLDLRNTPRMRDSRSFFSHIDGFVNNFVNAGMGIYPKHQIERLEIEANTWNAVLRGSGSGSAAELSGHYYPSVEQFVVDRIEFHLKGDLESRGAIIEYSEYQFQNFVDRFVPGRVALVSAKGEKQREYLFGTIEYFNPAEFKKIAQIPDSDHPDPLRPKEALRIIDDFRPKAAVRTEVDSQNGERLVTPLADDREFADQFSWNFVGWIVLVALVFLGLLVHYKKK